MHENQLYEYAVIRVVPKVEREEFVNVGVVLFCKKARYIRVMQRTDASKIRAFCDTVDLDQIQQNLEAFEKIAAGDPSAGPIALMDVPSRFRWLTAVRSSMIQTSRPHPGLCTDMDHTLQRLFDDMVG